ncbi:MAG: tryptophanase [Planctomycetes bacterium]|nr:tryptophanase [Planctomycetota bacterium]
MCPVIFEPFKIKTVEPLAQLTRSEREAHLERAGRNLFGVSAEAVTFDFLTDSGQAAMSTEQWSAVMRADESYAGSRSFARFERAVKELCGYKHVIPTHQGRAAERILFSLVSGPGKVIPSNCHFDTTRANIEYGGGEALDLVIDEAADPSNPHPFKGNVNLERLERLVRERRADIPLGMVTITNNSAGGQPVSLENLRGVSRILRGAGILFLLDACRFAENCWFIRERERGQSSRSPLEIAREVFSLADGCTVSGKKDALVNMGGFLALDDDELALRARNLLILTEGFPTYGGCSARDLEAMAVGLHESLEPSYLEYRSRSTAYLAEGLEAVGYKTVRPTGGHAVYIDARALLPHIPPEQYPGQVLACELYLHGGIRSCEIGSVMFGKRAADGRFVGARNELVRLAIPRRVYTQSHVDRVVELAADVAVAASGLRGLRMTYRPEYLPHFTGRFAPVEAAEPVFSG